MATRTRPQSARGELDGPGVTESVRSGGSVVVNVGGTWTGEIVIEVSADDGETWVELAQNDEAHPLTSPDSLEVAVPDGTLVRLRAVALTGEAEVGLVA